jgi:predicted transcriptional regulator
MPRFLVDIPDDDLVRLDSIAKAEGRSRAAVIRDAVAEHIAASTKDWLEAGFGLWAKYGFTEDGLEYQNRLREEWVREWDADIGPNRRTRSDGQDDAAA